MEVFQDSICRTRVENINVRAVLASTTGKVSEDWNYELQIKQNSTDSWAESSEDVIQSSFWEIWKQIGIFYVVFCIVCLSFVFWGLNWGKAQTQPVQASDLIESWKYFMLTLTDQLWSKTREVVNLTDLGWVLNAVMCFLWIVASFVATKMCCIISIHSLKVHAGLKSQNGWEFSRPLPVICFSWWMEIILNWNYSWSECTWSEGLPVPGIIEG